MEYISPIRVAHRKPIYVASNDPRAMDVEQFRSRAGAKVVIKRIDDPVDLGNADWYGRTTGFYVDSVQELEQSSSKVYAALKVSPYNTDTAASANIYAPSVIMVIENNGGFYALYGKNYDTKMHIAQSSSSEPILWNSVKDTTAQTTTLYTYFTGADGVESSSALLCSMYYDMSLSGYYGGYTVVAENGVTNDLTIHQFPNNGDAEWEAKVTIPNASVDLAKIYTDASKKTYVVKRLADSSLIFTINGDGSSGWAKSIDLPEYQYGEAKIVDGGGNYIIVMLSSRKIIKMSKSNGAILWSKTVNLPVTDITISGTAIIMNMTDGTDGVFAMIDDAGQVLWVRKFSSVSTSVRLPMLTKVSSYKTNFATFGTITSSGGTERVFGTYLSSTPSPEQYNIGDFLFTITNGSITVSDVVVSSSDFGLALTYGDPLLSETTTEDIVIYNV